ncbi:MAG: 4Fe-4S dicluster domain-containing protein [Firmicutes bacterium]|nr:4Fe-4S dicluster domain-containing protein [Bacillota bacterium]
MGADIKANREPLLMVDREKCSGCAACLEVCPMGLIALDSGGFPMEAGDREMPCMGCGHCVAVCPLDAMEHTASPLEDSPVVPRELLPSAEQVSWLLKSRRSIREFKQRPVEEEKITELIRTASCAPSGANVQPVEWIVVNRPETMDCVREVTLEWIKELVRQQHELVRNIPVERYLRDMEGGKDRLLRGAPALVIAKADKNSIHTRQDIEIALSYFEIAAASQGLGTCWLAQVARVIQFYPPMRELLGMSDDDEYYFSMLLGYPKYTYRRVPKRREPRISFM